LRTCNQIFDWVGELHRFDCDHWSGSPAGFRSVIGQTAALATNLVYIHLMDTLLLTRSELRALLEPPELLDALREAFAAYSLGRSVNAMRVPVPLPVGAVPPGASGMLLAPGIVPGVPAYSVKVHAKFPGGDPAIQGLLVLHDIMTGAVLAVIESSYLTALRTGLVGALGADVLARADASTVAIIGAGAQGHAQLAALRRVRPVAVVRIFDPVSNAAKRLAADPASQGLDVVLARDLDDALDGADIVVTATWAEEPFILRRHLRRGLHITTVGPDQPGKCEVAAEALLAASIVVDDRTLAVTMGAVGNAGLTADAIHAELGEIVAGVKSGRLDDSDITIFASVGLAFQDLAAGWLAYRRAKELGIGRSLDFFA
jgi:ornithine cyclodeaminase/alanine dehydrogenase-like protein (mu-crystallin family)